MTITPLDQALESAKQDQSKPDAYETQGPKEFTVPAGTRVLVGAPLNIPEGLEAALRQVLSRNNEVEAAYLGQVRLMIEGAKPRLFLVLKIQEKGKPFLKNIQENVVVATRGFLQEGEHMSLQVYDGKGISSDVVKSVKPFFMKKGRLKRVSYS
jgi:hypothetical protein